MRPHIVVVLPVLLLRLSTPALAQIEEFVETFSGSGPYASVDGRLEGFNNSGWTFSGFCGQAGPCDAATADVYFRADGLIFENKGRVRVPEIN